MRNVSLLPFTLFATSLFAGCALDADPAEAPVERIEQALSGDFVDATGTVTVRIKECGWVGPSNRPTATCSMDADFVLIGGGAQIENQGNALLTASYPDSGLSTWWAASKDHYYGYPHRLRAYAIGLKLAGISSATLRSYVRLESRSSTSASHSPSATAELPSGYKLIGGGASMSWNGSGILLTESSPDGFQWVARGKDHIYGDTGLATAYAIGITTGTIPGFGELDVTVNSVSSWTNSGYATATASTPSGWVLGSVGGVAQYSGAGRMLGQLVPFLDNPTNTRPGATVGSKDHRYHNAGTTTAYAISVRRR